MDRGVLWLLVQVSGPALALCPPPCQCWRRRLEGRWQRRGLHSCHSLRYRGSLPAGQGAPMQGWVSVGIKDNHMLCKHEPEESQRGVSDLGAALG